MIWLFLIITYLPSGQLGVTPYGGFESSGECQQGIVHVMEEKNYPEGRVIHITGCFAAPAKKATGAGKI